MKDNRKIKKIAVGLSGGVDSAVTAALLKEQGYEVIGVHMLKVKESISGCTSEEDRNDALRVAKKLEIPFRVVDFTKEYREQVIKRFLDEYQNGRTPNPDIWCNEVMKFGLFLEYALNELKVDAIATGHYARIECDETNQEYMLLTGVDETKDQSYFLYRLNQFQLSKSLFPLGEMTKVEVRKLAQKYDLPTKDKKESMGVCFIGDINMQDYLKTHLDIKPGEVRDISGKVIGTHEGVQLYTIGQRHGFTLNAYQGTPMYVIKKEIENNQLIVGNEDVFATDQFIITGLHYVRSTAKDQPLLTNIKIRIRHLGELIPCQIEPIKSHLPAIDGLKCTIQKPDNGVAEGQHAVLYLGDEVIGGGTIMLSTIDGIR